METLKNLTIEKEEITVRGHTLKIFLPAKLEEIFQGDPFLEVEKFPFWARVWESSLVLADYVVTIEPPKKILEIGAGLGVPSLAAAKVRHKVCATDFEKLPLEFIKLSAKENNLTIETQILDWTKPNLSGKFDLIIGSEVVFRKSLFKPLIELFKNYLEEGGEVILSHPSERKRTLIPFLHEAQKNFKILTSIRKLKSEGETVEIILNKLLKN
ncbi:MAG: methyltransferase domain-containing protein [Thermodesulfobacterium sp.]|nr:methyltransferase domain-containing protein [Thermodesulfobacterium sp.]